MTADGVGYRWAFRRRRGRRVGHEGSTSVLSLWMDVPRSTLRIVFRPSDLRLVAHGHFDEGAVMRLPDREHMNLHRPGDVRALLDEAVARGLLPTARTTEVDGWPLFDTAVAHRDPGGRCAHTRLASITEDDPPPT